MSTLKPLDWNTYLRWLGPVFEGERSPAVSAPDIAAWSTDSRSIAPGQWFVPISGANFDGHRFIEAAMAQGASGFLVESRRLAELPENIRHRGLLVRDCLEAFQQMTAGWRTSLKDLKLIALTGSVGKTTTKEMLGSILRAEGPTFSTEGSFNNEVGVPKTLQQLRPEHRYAALEFGARMPGNIKFLCELGRPDVAGLINVGKSHLGIFGSPENLLNTKLEIFRDSPAHCIQVANADDPRIALGAASTGKRTVSFGCSSSADVRASDVQWHPSGAMTMQLFMSNKAVPIQLQTAHESYPINAAAAAAMALAAGVSEQSVQAGLATFRGIKGRFQILRLGGLTVIDDTYNASPDSVRAGLGSVDRTFHTSKKVLVLGDMFELGDDSDEDHRRVGRMAAALAPEALIAVGKDAKLICEGAHAGGLSPTKAHSFAAVEDLIAAKLPYERWGDLIYAKASNGVRLRLLIESLQKAFP